MKFYESRQSCYLRRFGLILLTPLFLIPMLFNVCESLAEDLRDVAYEYRSQWPRV